MEEALEIEDGSETDEIDEAENVAFDGDRPVNRTYYIGCQAVNVYTNSFNAKGNKVRDSANHIPQVSCTYCSLLLLQFISYEDTHVPLDRGGKVVVRPSNDKRPTSSNEGTLPSNSPVSEIPSSQTLNLILVFQ